MTTAPRFAFSSTLLAVSAALSTAVLAAAAPAVAGAVPNALVLSDETASIAVPYGDLDLMTADGRAQLEKRIDRAAARICNEQVSVADRLAMSAEAGRCVTQTRARGQQLAVLAVAKQKQARRD
ncbi:UrcA family protein [Novosphingobium sp. FSY-8]|uniref:UrcA family protein n=1 Tax=Novosphingobium ovatum TaxID=1908523 RepID=A0ABW9XGU1_9SPHN|nr:UrcA family protein [Novosphingobium ovatum]NBC37769.1 UrcA family protein [Novosphingobium ovatum]